MKLPGELPYRRIALAIGADSSGDLSRNLSSRLRDAFLPKGTRILMAEDDPISAKVLQIALSKFRYEPVVARDGAEAWEKFDRKPLAAL